MNLRSMNWGRPINFDRLIIFPFSTRTLPFLCRRFAVYVSRNCGHTGSDGTGDWMDTATIILLLNRIINRT